MASSTIQASLLSLGNMISLQLVGFTRPATTAAGASKIEDKALGIVRRLRHCTDPIASLIVQGKNDEMDSLAVQAVAFVAWQILGHSHSATNPSEIAKAVCHAPDTEAGANLLQVRRLVSRLLRNGVFKPRDLTQGWNPPLTLRLDALCWLTGTGGSRRSAGAKSPKRNTAASPQPLLTMGSQPAATRIYRWLTQRVIGLDGIVRSVSGQLAMHLQRARMIGAGNDPGTPNVVSLFIGQSGVGKTWLAETIGEICGGFGSSSAADMTEEGWCGLSVSDALVPVLQSVGNDAAKARQAVCFIDEIDKKRATGGMARDISGAGFQVGLLRLVEGTDYIVGGRRGGWDAKTQVNSRGMMFILGGAFVGLDEILGRQAGRGVIGFDGRRDGGKHGDDIRAGLVEFGMLPELVNRCSSILVFPPPTVPVLESIATAPAPAGVIATYARLLEGMGINLSVSPAGVRRMAEYAHANGYARALKSLMGRIAEYLMFDDCKGKVTIDAHDVGSAIDGMTEGLTPGTSLATGGIMDCFDPDDLTACRQVLG